MARTLWRVFPWGPESDPGTPFSPEFLPEQSGQGRFDLPARLDASSWYFAETAEHAVAEKLQDLRNRTLRDDFLFERGHRLAHSAVEVAGRYDRVADLCDPVELLDRSVAPDRLASRNRTVTQGIAERMYGDADLSGFRWWSALFGDWHTVVLFSDRVPASALNFSPPVPLHLDTDAVVRAAGALGIELEAP